jgi:hypothetical protein
VINILARQFSTNNDFKKRTLNLKLSPQHAVKPSNTMATCSTRDTQSRVATHASDSCSRTPCIVYTECQSPFSRARCVLCNFTKGICSLPYARMSIYATYLKVHTHQTKSGLRQPVVKFCGTMNENYNAAVSRYKLFLCISGSVLFSCKYEACVVSVLQPPCMGELHDPARSEVETALHQELLQKDGIVLYYTLSLDVTVRRYTDSPGSLCPTRIIPNLSATFDLTGSKNGLKHRRP